MGPTSTNGLVSFRGPGSRCAAVPECGGGQGGRPSLCSGWGQAGWLEVGRGEIQQKSNENYLYIGKRQGLKSDEHSQEKYFMRILDEFFQRKTLDGKHVAEHI